MSRRKPPSRRFSLTGSVPIVLDGREFRVILTVGIYEGRLMEIFCADFKAGTSIHSMVQDACVMLSRLLQYGDTPEELSLGLIQEPPSLLGSLIREAIKIFDMHEAEHLVLTNDHVVPIANIRCPDDDPPEPSAPADVPPRPTDGGGTVAAVPGRSRSELIEEARAKGYESVMCDGCYNFTMVRNGTCLKCDSCGATTGCS